MASFRKALWQRFSTGEPAAHAADFDAVEYKGYRIRPARTGRMADTKRPAL
jgi:hypothetical protein